MSYAIISNMKVQITVAIALAACAMTLTADILVAAVGRPRLITADHVKPGATVIDVGINDVDGALVGDVDFDTVAPVAGVITPVPGGVGPLTTTMLMANTVAAAAGRIH